MALMFCVLLSICCFHASIGQELCGACDSGNEEHNGSCYYFSTSVANHSTANSSCQNLGFHLVVISSPEEQSFVVHHLLNAAVNHWIGLTTDEGGNRVWSDGSSVTYSNYGESEAFDDGSSVTYSNYGESEAFDDGGFCFRLRPSQNYTWYDQNCSYSYRYICKRDIVCSTSPSSEAHTSPPQQTSLAQTTRTSDAPQITTSNATTLSTENGSVATTIATGASESTPQPSTSAAITSIATSSSPSSSPSEATSEGSTSAGAESYVPTTMTTQAMPATIKTTAEPTTSTIPSSSTTKAGGEGPTDVSSGGNSTVSTAATNTTSTSIMTTTPMKRARMGCTNFRLVADDSTLTDALVRSWYTVSSVIGCAQRCLDDVSCSLFTFIALERVCLLGGTHDMSGSSYELRIGATTYSVV